MNTGWNQRLRTICTAAAITLATLLPASALDDNGNGNAHGKNKNYPYGAEQTSSRPYSIGLWGDLPYSQSQADALPAVIQDMNSQDLAFTVQAVTCARAAACLRAPKTVPTGLAASSTSGTSTSAD